MASKKAEPPAFNPNQRTALSGHAGHTWSLLGPFPKNQLPNMTYDVAGEVTTDNNGYVYTYDGEGRIVTANTGSYLYDGDGNRVMKTVGGTTTLYWPGANGVADESNAAGTAFGKQITLAGIQVWSEDTAGTGKFLFQDHLGSVRVTGDAAGTVHDDIDYYPFGDKYNNYGSSPSDNHYLFTGDESDDAETKTDYSQYRNLSGSMARFNRPDPYDGSYDPTNPQSLNRFSYVMNRPMVFLDPSGLSGIGADGCYSGQINGDTTGSDNIYHQMILPYVFCAVGDEFEDTGGDLPDTNDSGHEHGVRTLSKLPKILRCASNAANAVSAASLLPPNAPKFFQNMLSNDVASISDLVIGPDRTSAAISIAQGKGLNLGGQAIGAIPYGPDRFILRQNGAGTYYTKDFIEGVVANTSLARGLSKALGIVSGIKLGYDIGTYAEAVYLCRFQ